MRRDYKMFILEMLMLVKRELKNKNKDDFGNIFLQDKLEKKLNKKNVQLQPETRQSVLLQKMDERKCKE